MTKDEILAAAKEAGIFGEYGVELGAISRFAAIIEKRTIEKCANACIAERLNDGDGQHAHWYKGVDICTKAIRALGEQ